MLKFLLTILMFSSGLRIVLANGLSMPYPDIEKVCLEDPEDGKDKAEKKQTKQIADDTFPAPYHVDHGALYTSAVSKLPLRHHTLRPGFVDQPNTPPPNSL